MNLVDDHAGLGYLLSLEAGQRIEIDQQWSVTPQAQLTYASVGFGDFTDPFGAKVSLGDGDSLIGRLGTSIDHENSWHDEGGEMQRVHLYGAANVSYEFLTGTRVMVADTPVHNKPGALTGGLDIGGSYNWADDKYSLYGDASASTDLTRIGHSYALAGTVGFRAAW